VTAAQYLQQQHKSSMESTITQRYRFFTKDYQDFISSEELRINLLNTALDLGLEDTEVNAFDNAITLYLLAFLNQDDLISFLIEECDIIPEVAIKVVDQFVSSIPEGVNQQLKKLNTLTTQQTDDTVSVADIGAHNSTPRHMQGLESQAPLETPVYRSEQAEVVPSAAAVPAPPRP
jgi:hypothetical protein